MDDFLPGQLSRGQGAGEVMSEMSCSHHPEGVSTTEGSGAVDRGHVALRVPARSFGVPQDDGRREGEAPSELSFLTESLRDPRLARRLALPEMRLARRLALPSGSR